MGDPVTMAVIGSSIGAITSPRNPLKGALMGAAGGYAGGAMLGAGASGGAASAATGGGFAGGGYGSVGLAGQTALGGAAPASGGMFANTLGGIGKDISAVQKWSAENPFASSLAQKAVPTLLSPEQQPQMQAPGVLRGTPSQMAAQQHNIARPPVSLI